MGRCELPETSQNKRGSTYRVCCSRWLDRARHRSRNAGKMMSTHLTPIDLPPTHLRSERLAGDFLDCRRSRNRYNRQDGGHPSSVAI
jgi:hypothetical protein